MAYGVISRKGAAWISGSLLTLGFVILGVFQAWRPWIFLALGIPLVVRQYVLGRGWDMLSFIFIDVLVYLLVLGGAFLLMRLGYF